VQGKTELKKVLPGHQVLSLLLDSEGVNKGVMGYSQAVSVFKKYSL